MSLSYDGYETLGRAMFCEAQLGDRRRNARLVGTFDELCRHPGGSLPEKLAAPANLKALYHLCACPEVTHAALLAPVRAYTLENIARQPGYVVLVHDATELDYTTRTSLTDDLGQIGNGHYRGYLAQHVLAVDPQTRTVLGLMDQVLHCRDEVPDNETLPQLRDRETRESLLWIKGTRYLPSDRRLVDVADQGADTFEFLEHELRSGRTFVVRTCKQRKVRADHAGLGAQQYFDEHARSLPVLGTFTMDVQAQKGRKARKDAKFEIRGGAVLVYPPHARRGHHGKDPLPLYVVFVEEMHPPKGQKVIQWRLLTNEPVATFTDAWRVISWYETRWVVEEYHKALKTGCAIESLQFTAVERLQPAIALLSAVALTLLNLRDASRLPDAQTRRATTVIAREYVEVLSAWRYGKVRLNVTVHEFYFDLARLGGHQNRRHDKSPGWLILWRGWTKLQAMLDGYLARTKSG